MYTLQSILCECITYTHMYEFMLICQNTCVLYLYTLYLLCELIS